LLNDCFNHQNIMDDLTTTHVINQFYWQNLTYFILDLGGVFIWIYSFMYGGWWLVIFSYEFDVTGFIY